MRRVSRRGPDGQLRDICVVDVSFHQRSFEHCHPTAYLSKVVKVVEIWTLPCEAQRLLLLHGPPHSSPIDFSIDSPPHPHFAPCHTCNQTVVLPFAVYVSFLEIESSRMLCVRSGMTGVDVPALAVFCYRRMRRARHFQETLSLWLLYEWFRKKGRRVSFYVIEISQVVGRQIQATGIKEKHLDVLLFSEAWWTSSIISCFIL